ncbi:MAG: carbohydrate ABC transporter permease [Devosiaceae bacterium]|nr:carbohydrate ABC transporter permease [Devosiaceae bacterium]
MKRTLLGTGQWLAALVMAFPVVWMVLTSFKTETEAFSAVPSFLLFEWTGENYANVILLGDYFHHAWNSIIISIVSSAIGLLIALMAAWSFAFAPTRHSKNILLWMLSTKMMPSVGVFIPIYILFRDGGFLDTRIGMIIILMLMNLPIMIWMLYSFFKEVPAEILEACRMDGASLSQEIRHVLIPLSLPGIASTFLLTFILSWNECFWTLNLTTADAAPLSVFIASYSSPEGLFWAKLSAASTMAVLPILIIGWLSQRQLVRGMTFGAVK